MSSSHRTKRILPRQRGIALLATLLSVLTAACASETLKPELISPQAVVLDLPVMHQDELYECGLVSITALCQYYKVEMPPAERAELVRMAREEHGLSGQELRTALEKLGMEVFIFPGTLDHSETGLYHHADGGRPLLVMRSKNGKTNHYCLVLGYDEPLGNVFLLDPVLGRISTPATAFDNDWQRVDRFTLLALPAHPVAVAVE